jgi:hypothetical protein
MNNRERALAILNYQSYDRVPIAHFGFWRETLEKWASEGHLDPSVVRQWGDGNPVDVAISAKLGLDINWGDCFSPITGLLPPFEETVLEELPDGSRKMLNRDGAVVLNRPGAVSIASEVDHLLKGRTEWESLYLPRLAFSKERITGALVGINFPFSGDKTATFPNVSTGSTVLPWDQGGLEYLREGKWERPYGHYCGSLLGLIRDWLGLVGLSYLQVDDPELLDEMLGTVEDLCFECARTVLESGVHLDFGHFWEDVCFRSGPLVHPRVFRDKIGPRYRRMTDLLHSHGINLVSVDCDGMIDDLIPVWLDNGVNVMFPIEVGVWNGNLAPWRAKYGRELRGVGGVDKRVLSQGRAAIDAEVERLKPLVNLGGYLPCLDHRIPPDAEWDSVLYYCEMMRRAFG